MKKNILYFLSNPCGQIYIYGRKKYYIFILIHSLSFCNAPNCLIEWFGATFQNGILKACVQYFLIDIHFNISKHYSMEPTSSLYRMFEEFLEGVPENKLSGLHVLSRRAMEKRIHLLSKEAAFEVYKDLVGQNGKKKRKNWKIGQVSLLAYLIDKSCLKFQTNIYTLPEEVWEKLGQLLPHRNSSICRSKLLSLWPIKIEEAPWTDEEDELLSKFIEEHGLDWKRISEELHRKNPQGIYRTSKQCKEHYGCFLKPDLKKGYWGAEEDYNLICSYLKYGKKWSKISQEIEGRNQNAIKNRFYLLFQSNSKHKKKAYHSEVMRNIKRKKQRLEATLKINNQQTPKRKDQLEPQDQKNQIAEGNSDNQNRLLEKFEQEKQNIPATDKKCEVPENNGKIDQSHYSEYFTF